MSIYLDSDRYTHEVGVFDHVIKEWVPIRIYPSDRFQVLSMTLDTEVGIMFEWCSDNCEKRWTAIWRFQNYYFYFESKEDSTHFYLAWCNRN